jgi:hypothetical protein
MIDEEMDSSDGMEARRGRNKLVYFDKSIGMFVKSKNCTYCRNGRVGCGCYVLYYIRNGTNYISLTLRKKLRWVQQRLSSLPGLAPPPHSWHGR